MTENLLFKVEEKILLLLAEVETMRKQIQQLRYENNVLKSAQTSHAEKLQGLIALFDVPDKATV